MNRLTEWACGLKVGDDVVVQLAMPEEESEPVAGVIRGSGTRLLSAIDYGLQFVVEITVKPGCDQIIRYIL